MPFVVGLSEAGSSGAFTAFLSLLTSFISWVAESLGTIGNMVMETPIFLIPIALVIVGAVIGVFKILAH